MVMEAVREKQGASSEPASEAQDAVQPSGKDDNKTPAGPQAALEELVFRKFMEDVSDDDDDDDSFSTDDVLSDSGSSLSP